MSARESSGAFLSLGRRDLLLVAGVWAIWTAATLLLAYLAAVLPAGNPSPWGPDMADKAPPLARWDAGWYSSVAEKGYRFAASESGDNVRFYPLYPMAMRLVSRTTGLSTFCAGTLVSVISLLLALVLLADLVARETGAERILPVLIALLCFPTAFYFAAVYSESLFFLTTLAAFWAARRDHWLLAGAAGAAACLTRLNGVLIFVPLAFLAWLSIRDGKKAGPIAALALTVAGGAAYPLFLWKTFGSPLVYFHTAAGWTHKPTLPWQLVRHVLSELVGRLRGNDGPGEGVFFLCFFSAFLFTMATIALFFRGPRDGALYAAATMLLFASSGSIDALPRYVLPLFPCFVLFGRLVYRSKLLLFAYVFVGMSLFGVLVHRFVHWVWVA